MYSSQNISHEKAAPIIALMRRPRLGTSAERAIFKELEDRITTLKLPEIFGLILTAAKEDIRVLLKCLDDLRWVFVGTSKTLDSEVERVRQSICYYPRFLNPYNNELVPAQLWAEAAANFRQLYEADISEGVVPRFNLPQWRRFYDQYIPATDAALANIKFYINRHEPEY